MSRTKSAFRTVAEPLAAAVVLAFVVRAAIRIYSIPSESMMPTLEAGDRIVATPYLFSDPQRGHVVVFRSATNPDELVVKRIIAVPGDLVDAQYGRVRVGGHTLPEPYLLRQGSSGTFTAQIVAPESYFVAGDNRGSSYDSRQWGPLPRARIIGRARLVLWSSHDTATSGRGRRLFKWIE
jgi:signal peptidase I